MFLHTLKIRVIERSLVYCFLGENVLDYVPFLQVLPEFNVENTCDLWGLAGLRLVAVEEGNI